MNAQRVGFVTVISGIYAQSFPLAGVSIREVRRRLTERMKILTKAVAIVDGKQADEETRLAGGEVLTFVRLAGEMGAGD